jgi:hypothetical protein
MPKYLIIREGRTANKSQPIFVSADPELIQAIGVLIAERLEPDDMAGQKAAGPLVAEPLDEDNRSLLSLVRKPD